MKTPQIETQRLLLREVLESDAAAAFHCWMQDEHVSRYMWWKASTDQSAADEFVRFELAQIDNPLWHRWIALLKDTGEIIGTCLVFYNDEETHWDISYNLGRRYWGYGYATEMMKAALRYAADALDMKECITSYAQENTASANVLYKLGFQDLKQIPYVCNGGEIQTTGMLCKLTVGGEK